jgi:hypothetical protein
LKDLKALSEVDHLKIEALQTAMQDYNQNKIIDVIKSTSTDDADDNNSSANNANLASTTIALDLGLLLTEQKLRQDDCLSSMNNDSLALAVIMDSRSSAQNAPTERRGVKTPKRGRKTRRNSMEDSLSAAASDGHNAEDESAINMTIAHPEAAAVTNDDRTTMNRLELHYVSSFEDLLRSQFDNYKRDKSK